MLGIRREKKGIKREQCLAIASPHRPHLERKADPAVLGAFREGRRESHSKERDLLQQLDLNRAKEELRAHAQWDCWLHGAEEQLLGQDRILEAFPLQPRLLRSCRPGFQQHSSAQLRRWGCSASVRPAVLAEVSHPLWAELLHVQWVKKY